MKTVTRIALGLAALIAFGAATPEEARHRHSYGSHRGYYPHYHHRHNHHYRPRVVYYRSYPWYYYNSYWAPGYRYYPRYSYRQSCYPRYRFYPRPAITVSFGGVF